MPLVVCIEPNDEVRHNKPHCVIIIYFHSKRRGFLPCVVLLSASLLDKSNNVSSARRNKVMMPMLLVSDSNELPPRERYRYDWESEEEDAVEIFVPPRWRYDFFGLL